MKFNVVHTDNFERELKRLAKKHRSIKEDLRSLITRLEEDPKQGRSIGRNCYKIRMAIASKGKGKSGGARIITHVYVVQKTIFLLSIYDESDQEGISDKELEMILRLLNTP